MIPRGKHVTAAAVARAACSRPIRSTAVGTPAKPLHGNFASEGIVEVTGLHEVLPGDSDEAWAIEAKQLLRKAFGVFGPVVDVRLPTSVASVRFANGKTAEAVMVAAPRGFMQLGDGEVRIRVPSAPEAVWRKFPPPRPQKPASAAEAFETTPGEVPATKKQKVRPNERFATKAGSDAAKPLNESERFWEAQHELRGAPAKPPIFQAPPQEPTPEPEPAPTAQRPSPSVPSPDASPDEMEACKGEEEVSKEMGELLERPFSQQRKALKALRLRWHPDKRPECQTVATRVFQFIQAHDDWLADHGVI